MRNHFLWVASLALFSVRFIGLFCCLYKEAHFENRSVWVISLAVLSMIYPCLLCYLCEEAIGRESLSLSEFFLTVCNFFTLMCFLHKEASVEKHYVWGISLVLLSARFFVCCTFYTRRRSVENHLVWVIFALLCVMFVVLLCLHTE